MPMAAPLAEHFRQKPGKRPKNSPWIKCYVLGIPQRGGSLFFQENRPRETLPIPDDFKKVIR